MKLHTEIITICDYAHISNQGKLYIDGIFDELIIDTNKNIGIEKCFFIVTICGEPYKTYKIKLVIEDETEKIIHELLDSEVETSANGKNNMSIELINTPFKKLGKYNFCVYNEGEKIASTTLNIHGKEEKSITEKILN